MEDDQPGVAEGAGAAAAQPLRATRAKEIRVKSLLITAREEHFMMTTAIDATPQDGPPRITLQDKVINVETLLTSVFFEKDHGLFSSLEETLKISYQ
jgi:hypothetical protein